jgi:hypothetical protein
MTRDSQIERHFDTLFPQFFQGNDQPNEPPKEHHSGLNKPVQLTHPFSSNYPAGGARALTDGSLAEPRFPNFFWQGFHGVELEAVVDLEESLPIHEVTVDFLQQVNVGIFLPTRLLVSLSADGEEFQEVAALEHDISPRSEGPLVHSFSVALDGPAARYVKVKTESLLTIPDWHHSAGVPAWLFVDEIRINPSHEAGVELPAREE